MDPAPSIKSGLATVLAVPAVLVVLVLLPGLVELFRLPFRNPDPNATNGEAIFVRPITTLMIKNGSGTRRKANR